VLKELEVENRKAKIKSDEVAIVQKNCLEQKTTIEGEKEAADKDLAKAMPFLDKAIAAADSIQAKDISELGGMRNAVDTTRLILDAVQILFQRTLDSVKPRSLTILKTDIPFVNDSFDNHTKKTLTSKDFLKDITDFSNNQKD